MILRDRKKDILVGEEDTAEAQYDWEVEQRAAEEETGIQAESVRLHLRISVERESTDSHCLRYELFRESFQRIFFGSRIHGTEELNESFCQDFVFH